MFEKAIVRRAGIDREVDIGQIAETVFFYGQSHILLDSGVVRYLTQVPCDDLLSMLSRQTIQLTYLQSHFGVVSSGFPKTHSFANFQIDRKPGENKPHSYDQEIELTFREAYGNSGHTKRAAKRLLDRIVLFRDPQFQRTSNIVCDLSRSDIADRRFLKNAVAAIIRWIAPGYELPIDFQFDLFDTGNGYAVITNLDFSVLTVFYRANRPPDTGELTPALLLSYIQDARADTFFASHYMAELVTSELCSDIIRLKHYDFLKRRERSSEDIGTFIETVSDNCPTIREVINSKNRTISEFLKLLDQADKFKAWMQSTNPDKGLLNAYFAEATKSTWAEHIPGKSVRLVTVAGISSLAELAAPSGIAAGLEIVASALDTFLLDKLLQGWKPTHFITGPYKTFVQPPPKAE